MVFSITVTQRGKQAAGKGLPQGAARNAVMAFGWIAFAVFLFNAAAVFVDRCARVCRLWRGQGRAERSALLSLSSLLASL